MKIKLYLISLITFLTLDSLWIGFLAKNFYQQQIGFLLTENVNWVAAITFYIIYVGAINFFVVKPAILKNSIKYAMYAGAFFGFSSYAAYDLTNLATIKNWPVLITIVDLMWGTILTSVVSLVTIKAHQHFSVNKSK